MDGEIYILLIIPVYAWMGAIWYKLGKLEGLINGRIV